MTAEIWEWYRGFYKVFLFDSKKKQQIISWQGCKEHCKYFFLDGRRGWDVIFPSKLYNKVARLVSLPYKTKNHKRVLQGKRLGRLAIEKDRLGIKKDYEFSNN